MGDVEFSRAPVAPRISASLTLLQECVSDFFHCIYLNWNTPVQAPAAELRVWGSGLTYCSDWMKQPGEQHKHSWEKKVLKIRRKHALTRTSTFFNAFLTGAVPNRVLFLVTQNPDKIVWKMSAGEFCSILITLWSTLYSLLSISWLFVDKRNKIIRF